MVLSGTPTGVCNNIGGGGAVGGGASGTVKICLLQSQNGTTGDNHTMFDFTLSSGSMHG